MYDVLKLTSLRIHERHLDLADDKRLRRYVAGQQAIPGDDTNRSSVLRQAIDIGLARLERWAELEEYERTGGQGGRHPDS